MKRALGDSQLSKRFGTPPHTVEEWLEICARECENDPNPFRRKRMRSMAYAYRTAADLVRRAAEE